MDGGILVFGGADPDADTLTMLNDGALLQPGEPEGELLPEAPFDPPLWFPVVAPVSGGVLVVGTGCAEPVPDSESCLPGTLAMAHLDLTTREWTPVAPPEVLADAVHGPFVHLGTVDGDTAVLQLGERGSLWSWGVATGWRALARPPSPTVDVCSVGDELVALTGSGPDGALRLSHMTVVDGGRWESAPPPPTVRPIRSGLAWSDRMVLVTTRTGDVLRFSPGAGWSVTPPAPRLLVRGLVADEFRAGDDVVFRGLDQSFAYVAATDEWRPVADLPDLSYRGPVSTGEELVGYARDTGDLVPLALPSAALAPGRCRAAGCRR